MYFKVTNEFDHFEHSLITGSSNDKIQDESRMLLKSKLEAKNG